MRRNKTWLPRRIGVTAQRMNGTNRMAIRDFAEGDIPVGAGRSKGFGCIYCLTSANRYRRQGRDGVCTSSSLHSRALSRAEAEKVCIPDDLKPTVDKWLGAFDSWATEKSANSAQAVGTAPSNRYRRNPYLRRSPLVATVAIQRFGRHSAQGAGWKFQPLSLGARSSGTKGPIDSGRFVWQQAVRPP